MIRKFSLTNGVSVGITEELAAKYELDNAPSDAAFVSILAAIVAAQDRGELDKWGSKQVPLTTPTMSDADEKKLKCRYLGERSDVGFDEWGRSL